jgi:hypothetical protein
MTGKVSFLPSVLTHCLTKSCQLLWPCWPIVRPAQTVLTLKGDPSNCRDTGPSWDSESAQREGNSLSPSWVLSSQTWTCPFTNSGETRVSRSDGFTRMLSPVGSPLLVTWMYFYEEPRITLTWPLDYSLYKEEKKNMDLWRFWREEGNSTPSRGLSGDPSIDDPGSWHTS